MLTLKEVIPWGRSLAEYRRMFALTDADLNRSILGCADGPASFNAEWTLLGGRIISCDPLYRFDEPGIRRRIDETYPNIVEQSRLNAQQFLWSDDLPDPDALGRRRMSAMQQFLNDYEAGRRDGRYVDAELPALPFADQQFDLALASHFLFLYSEHFSEEFHIESVRELCRVATEVRVFHLLELGGQPSRHVAPVTAALQEDGFNVSIEQQDYEVRRGANQMLRVSR